MPQMFYLNPKNYFSSPDLSGILLLVPSYTQPTDKTRDCLEAATRCGADIAGSRGCSDPAFHRCLVAGQARFRIEENPGKWEFVCWIDDDMVFTPAHLAFLREACIVMKAAVTGIYCRRGQPSVACLRAIPEQDPPIASKHVTLYVPGGPETKAEFVSHPVTAGMGCLMLSVDQFIRHVKAYPAIRTAIINDREVLTPGMCVSTIATNADGLNYWLSEDEAYCDGLWLFTEGLWTCPIPFGHMSHVALIPEPDAAWLGGERTTPEAQSLPLPVSV